jgi:hypothetical protein
MIIQFNTDRNIKLDERHEKHFGDLINDGIERYSSNITRIEVHLSDENGEKEGPNDIRCLIEARLEGLQPIAVTSQANTEEQAILGALDKLRNYVKTTLGRIGDHKLFRGRK